ARWSVGIGIGFPVYAPYRPYYYHYYPYYYPPPVVLQPAYAPPPVTLAPAPATTPAPEVVSAPVPRAAAPDDRQADIDRRIQHLSNPDAKVRADVAIDLGKMKADRAVDALTATLS